MTYFEIPIIVALSSFLVIGLFSANHLRPLFFSRDSKYYTPHEKRLLRLPGVWLTASMWLLYLNNLLIALGIIGTILVLYITIDAPDDNVRIQLYTVLSFISSSLVNFSNSKEKSNAYRRAFEYYEPYCTKYEIRYGKPDAKNDEERLKYLFELVDKRMVAERIIAFKHEKPKAE